MLLKKVNGILYFKFIFLNGFANVWLWIKKNTNCVFIGDYDVSL